MYTTRTTLLEKIAAGDEIGWTEFFDAYRRLVFAIAKKSGIPDPDADDIVFFEVAMSKEGSFLVTGNTKHFPKAPTVVTPAQMLEILGVLDEDEAMKR